MMAARVVKSPKISVDTLSRVLRRMHPDEGEDELVTALGILERSTEAGSWTLFK